jgi:hypothetical protein
VISLELDFDGIADLNDEGPAKLSGQRNCMASRHLCPKPLALVGMFVRYRHCVSPTRIH